MSLTKSKGETHQCHRREQGQRKARNSNGHPRLGRSMWLVCFVHIVWTNWHAQGNTLRPLTRTLISHFPSTQTNKRGLTVDDHLRLVIPQQVDGTVTTAGSSSIFAIGDATSTSYAPTAQVASQQGAYLGRTLNQIGTAAELRKQLAATTEVGERENIERQIARIENAANPFHYSHQGSLAYIGSDRAIADLPFPFIHGNVSPLTFLKLNPTSSYCRSPLLVS
jgi:NADH dehydrogenase FAD-containing subunit